MRNVFTSDLRERKWLIKVEKVKTFSMIPLRNISDGLVENDVSDRVEND